MATKEVLNEFYLLEKREEIREYLARKLLPDWVDEDNVKDIRLSSEWLDAGEIIEHLHSVGVVLKVDRELPENPYDISEGHPGMVTPDHYKYNKAQNEMLTAGYVAVESLI